MKVFRQHVKIIVIALAIVVCMVASDLEGFGTVEAKADQPPVLYMAYNNGEFVTKSCNDYVTVSDANSYDMYGDQWYVFEGNVTITGRVKVLGTANIILKDDCVFTASEGIEVDTGNTLNIYGQGTINAGKLFATGGNGGAGIGSGNQGKGGSVTINGGIVTATGGYGGAGIGSGYGVGNNYREVEGSVTINGGIVTATGGYGGGAGIGSGSEGVGESVTINGGIVTATGGYDTNGGGAGIGGGRKQNVGTITINGGEVTANGGNGGAGIGSGASGFRDGVTITIKGGMIEAIGGVRDYNVGSGIGDGINVGNGTYELKPGMKWFSSTNETSGYEATTGTGTFGEKKRYAIVYKEQSAFMTASGSAITAKYIDGSGNKQSTNMEIEAPTDDAILFEDDASAQAKLNGCDDFNSALGRTGNS